jgi:hypothetical protein
MKKYDVPQELVDLMDEAIAASEARDSAVKGFFKFQVRNAVWLGKISLQKKREFWEKFRKLYPETTGKRMEYNTVRMEVTPWHGEEENPPADRC